jgi:antitoxin HigA-1
MPMTSTSGSSTVAARAVKRHPSMVTHPGEVLALCIAEGLHISVVEAARRLGISRQQLHRVLSGRSAMTPELALRVGRLCGNGPQLWMAMQVDWDLTHAEQRLGSALERVPSL